MFMQKIMRSSGNLIADRRFEYARGLAEAGDHAAAASILEQALQLAPFWPDGWLALGRARLRLGGQAGAAAAFRECLGCDISDPLGASLELARLDAAVTVDAAPEAYVKALFDSYAPRFDSALVEQLDYRGPQLLVEAVRRLRPGTDGKRFTRTLDLGCGTGLAGEAIAMDTAYLDGVDLSEGMLEEARRKAVYQNLTCANLLSVLMDGGGFYDLILAADVFNYLGDLDDAVTWAGRRLLPGGLLAFTVERADDHGGPAWRVQQCLRFAHTPGYAAQAVARAGLSLVELQCCVLRTEAGRDVTGMIVVAEAPRTEAVKPPSAALLNDEQPLEITHSMEV